MRVLPRQVAVDELGKRIAALPSRQHMTRPRPKADLVEHVRRFYSALHAWGHSAGTAQYRASWRQLIRACGYEDTAAVHRSVERYAALLRELGLAELRGIKKSNGQWRCLEVRLLEAAPVAELDTAGGRELYRARRVSGGRRRRMYRVGAPRAGRPARSAFKCVSRAGSKEGAAPRGIRAPAPGAASYSNLRTPLGVGPSFGSPYLSGEPGRANRGVLESFERDTSEPTSTQGATRPAALGGALNHSSTGRGHRALAVWLVQTVLADGDQAALDAAVAARRRGVDGLSLVLALWTAFRPAEPKAGPERREQLRRALRRLERYARFGAGDRGAGVELAGRLMLDHAAAATDAGELRLRSLAGIAAALQQTANSWRRADRARRGEIAGGALDGRRDGRPWTPERRPRGWEWPAEW